ncbi:MAG: hypothetical protein HYV67_04225 [Candidatus Taylorbacteria bacterium]|nr:hypothetical protein [Candidatus Taylorbacteria bacterium]
MSKKKQAFTAKKQKKKTLLVGFIGQGFVGKAYADQFEKRGFKTVRYALEKPYRRNKEKIKDCDIVFIAVPTPTTEKGFDDRLIRQAVKLVGIGKVAIIKSTILPGTTAAIQKENPNIFVFHSPEFLTEVTACHDAAHPNRNILGIPSLSKAAKAKAREVLAILPKAPFELVTGAEQAELIKYGGNCWFYFKVIFINMLYDTAKRKNIDWPTVRTALAADPRIGATHLEPVHKSGRGAGGHCFIKDFAAFSDLYRQTVDDAPGLKVLEGLRDKNIDLLLKSGKDLDLLAGVYGKRFLKKFKVKK